MAAAAVASLDDALALHLAGRAAEARVIYERLLAADPRDFDAMHLLGVACIQSGEPERAAMLLEAAARLDPDAPAVFANLAAALNQLQRHAAALAASERAVALEAGAAAAHSNRGHALTGLGRHAEALGAYDRALALAESADAWFNRGVALRALAQPQAALESFEQAIRLRPGYYEAICNRGALLAARFDYEAALAAFAAAVALRPDLPEAQVNRAAVLGKLGRLEEAIAGYDAAIAAAPGYADAYINKASALNDLKRTDEVLATCERALALKPGNPESLNNRGIALYDLRRPSEALAAYEAALATRPDFAEARFNRSLALLLTGDLKRGFTEYRWRWEVGDARRWRPRLDCPEWAGEPLAGRRIVVFSEQGFGDSLQFIRFAAPLQAMGAAVTALVEAPLVSLLRRSLPLIEVAGAVPPTAGFDFQAPLMCLPRLLGTTLETIPADVPYLTPDQDAAARWAERLAAYDGLKVGLVWAGAPRRHAPASHAVDRRRSMALAQLAPLGRVSGVRFFSLQLGEAAAQLAAPPPGLELVDLTAGLTDFGDTAAMVAGLDLVITVDTAVAHLAGALGKPVWVLSRFDGCWRWLGREDSPWYPTARVFHQRAPGDWAEVAERVAAALEAWRVGRS
ncbi:MAG TPA: tetratricopeptide repeat protein [Caulobacteraceae bacterium]|jgi:tetratricopeptide (TPR) repeat protein